jgi:hypothetical protein
MSQSQTLRKTNQQPVNKIRGILCCLGTIATVLWCANISRGVCASSQQSPLGREVADYADSGSDFSQVLFRSARQFGVPIGVVLNGREVFPPTISIRVSRGTVADVFNGIVGQESSLEWAELNGVVNVTPRESSNSILDVKVAHLVLKDATMEDVRQAIASIPEVKAWLVQNKVSERSVLSIPIAENSDQPRISVDFEGVPLRQIMNTIVKAPGMHAWSIVRYGKDRQYLNIGIG